MNSKIKFIDLPDVIKKSFMTKTVLCACAIFVFLYIGLTSDLFWEMTIVELFFVALIISQVFTIIEFMSNKYRLFRGICIQIKKPEFNLGTQGFKIFHMYGYSRAVLQMKDVQIQIPIYHGFDISEQDEITFYAKQNDFQKTSDSYFVVDSPKCIKVEKVKAA